MGAFMFTQQVARCPSGAGCRSGAGDGGRRDRARRPAATPAPRRSRAHRPPASRHAPEVLALCGPPDEEQDNAATTQRTLIYRHTRAAAAAEVPRGADRHGEPLGGGAAREVEIACDGELVSDVQIARPPRALLGLRRPARDAAAAAAAGATP